MKSTRTESIYLLSAINEAWSKIRRLKLNLNAFQEIHIEIIKNENNVPADTENDKICTETVFINDTIKAVNENVIAVMFCYYLTTTSKKYMGVTVYIKE
jgi:hypothetical protein